MEVVQPRCAGLDVSKRDVKVCVRIQGRGSSTHPGDGYHLGVDHPPDPGVAGHLIEERRTGWW